MNTQHKVGCTDLGCPGCYAGDPMGVSDPHKLRNWGCTNKFADNPPSVTEPVANTPQPDLFGGEVIETCRCLLQGFIPHSGKLYRFVSSCDLCETREPAPKEK